MYKSIFSKYLSIISLVVVLGFLAMTMFQVFLTANAMADDKRQLLLENAQSIARHTASSAEAIRGMDGEVAYRVDGNRLKPLLLLVSEAIDATMFITDSQGRVLLAAGTENDAVYENAVMLDDLVEDVGTEYYGIGTLDGLFAGRHYNAAVPVTIQGNVVLGYVVACAPADIFVQTLKSNLSIYVYSVLGALALSLAFV